MTDLQNINIEEANFSDSEILTDIAFSAKRHWNYPEKYLKQNIVYKASFDNIACGFYSIVENKSDFYSGENFVKKGFWLEHIFIKPEHHKIRDRKTINSTSEKYFIEKIDRNDTDIQNRKGRDLL
jgi:hypothetical protein